MGFLDRFRRKKAAKKKKAAGEKHIGARRLVEAFGRLRVGDLIDHRFMVHRILKGGMGVVYICVDQKHTRLLRRRLSRTSIFWMRGLRNVLFGRLRPRSLRVEGRLVHLPPSGEATFVGDLHGDVGVTGNAMATPLTEEKRGRARSRWLI